MSIKDRDLKKLILMIQLSRSRRESHLRKGALSEASLHSVIRSTEELLSSEPVLLILSGSFVVVGDLHGNIDDLLRVFDRFGYPPTQSYLFLGDYVDRGANSIETILFLYALKVLHPESIYLLRGNHESVDREWHSRFRAECGYFFDGRGVYAHFCESFTHLPIAAIVNDTIFCVHGGLSESIPSISDIPRLIEKPIKDVADSLADDFLWNDPSASVSYFDKSPRGPSAQLFGQQSLRQFLNDNGLSLMIRSHQWCANGTEEVLQGCLTVFTACDYCGRGNDGAVVIISPAGEVQVSQFLVRERAGHRFLFPPWIVEECATTISPIVPEQGVEALVEI
jgi:diadenosine tetraphosphatase ApaH/serine/threonine PP2A family protein phosphatase